MKKMKYIDMDRPPVPFHGIDRPLVDALWRELQAARKVIGGISRTGVVLEPDEVRGLLEARLND